MADSQRYMEAPSGIEDRSEVSEEKKKKELQEGPTHSNSSSSPLHIEFRPTGPAVIARSPLLHSAADRHVFLDYLDEEACRG